MNDFRVRFYFKRIKNKMQLLEKKYVEYSEVYKKMSSNCSLTYWKIKIKDVINLNNLLRSSRFKGYTTY